MSQFDFGTINPDTKSGSGLASDLNSWRDALHTMHRGSTRPSYIVAGMSWIDDSGTPWQIKMYNGTTDTTMATYNVTTGVFGGAANGLATLGSDGKVPSAQLPDIAPAAPYAFYKLDTSSVAFKKTAAGAISIKAGTRIVVADTLVSIATDTAVVMPTLTAGTDYAIYACADGTIRADASFNAPTGYTTANSRMIGGFHYGLVAAGTTVASGSFATTGSGMIWTQADVDKIAGINQYSIWDLKWRPQCDPRGMALVAGRTWVDIYFCGTNHIANGTSKAGSDIASGTVLPKIPLEFGGDGTATYSAPTWWDFLEIVNSHKKRLLREQEFVLAAYGVTENQSIDATQSTYPTTQRNAGYTSKYGLEQATGHHWTWGEDSAGSASAYVSNGGRGQSYNNSIVRVLFGGARTSGAYSGSRCSSWSVVPAGVSWSIGVRAACDHLILL